MGFNNISRKIFAFLLLIILSVTSVLPSNTAQAAPEPRQMEKLGRGVVAVRDGSDVFISWRLLALDPTEVGFNIYRTTSGEKEIKLNSSVLTEGTNFTDTSVDLTREHDYTVKPVINGKEQEEDTASSSFTFKANTADGPYLTVPLKSGGPIRNVWVGDFDGDGEYDYFVSRHKETHQIVEAYKRDGTFLWSANLGPNSENKNRISPGSATLDTGMWDGATVYDLDGDGKAEVILKIANGVTLGDGQVWNDSNNNKQWIAVLDGMTGKIEASHPLPDDYLSIGPLATQLGVGYVNGKTPSIVVFAKNRNKDKTFNLVVSTYSYNGSNMKMDWKWLRGSQETIDGHQMRIADLDGDGKDEINEVGFALNSDGSLRYTLADSNVRHGDRFYIGKFDPNSPGLQGYGVQQNNKTGILEHYYDATTGFMHWQHIDEATAGLQDIGRGDIGDLDPRYPGFEVWSFSGIYNGPTNTQITTKENQPYPSFRLWWDGDLLSESWNDGKIEKWNYETSKVSRLVTNYKFENAKVNDRRAPAFYGDIFGDWREEVVMTNNDYSKLVIFTTSTPSNTRLYTLAQNPMYRNSMTIKGYYQSHLPDYYLGSEMTIPSKPNIYLAE